MSDSRPAAGVYCRVAEASGEADLERQAQDCADMAARNGWSHDPARHLWTDVGTDYSADQPLPGLRAALGALDELDALIVVRIDRLTRSWERFAQYMETVQSAGLELVAGDARITVTPLSAEQVYFTAQRYSDG